MSESNNNYRCARCSDYPKFCEPGKCECLAHSLYSNSKS